MQTLSDPRTVLPWHPSLSSFPPNNGSNRLYDALSWFTFPVGKYLFLEETKQTEQRPAAFQVLLTVHWKYIVVRGPNKKSKNEQTRLKYAEIQEPSDLVRKLQLQ